MGRREVRPGTVRVACGAALAAAALVAACNALIDNQPGHLVAGDAGDEGAADVRTGADAADVAAVDDALDGTGDVRDAAPDAPDVAIDASDAGDAIAEAGDAIADAADAIGEAGDAIAEAGDATGADAPPEAEAGPPGPLLGVMSFGGAGLDSAVGAVFDSSGNAYVVGHIGPPSALVGGTSLTVVGSSSAVVFKLDPSGNLVWARSPTIAAGQPGEGRGIAINTRGNVVVGIDFGGTMTWGNLSLSSAGGHDVALVELDAGGNVVGGQHYGSTNDEQVMALAALPGGGLAMAGRFYCGVTPCTTNLGGATFTGQGGRDAFLLIVDGSYGHVFSTAWGGPLDDDPNALVSDPTGNLFLSGAISGAPTVGGKPLTTAGNLDVLLAAFTSTGSLVFAKTFGSTANDKGQGVAWLPGGDLVVTGALGGAVDFGGGPIGAAATEGFVARVSSSAGAYVWAEPFGTASTYAEAVGFTLGVGPSGTIAVPVVFTGTVDFGLGPVTSAGGHDALVLNLDAQGKPLWNWRLGGPSDDGVAGSAVDSHGNVVFLGQFLSTATIGSTSISSAGQADGFVARLGP